jgi:hypothetical protein
MTFSRPVARIEVSPELIVKALHFPEDTTIIFSQVKRGTHGYVVVFGVEHDDLPQVEEGEEAPIICPQVTYHRESWDFNWNADVEFPFTDDDISWTPEEYDYVDPYGDTA